MKPSDIDIFFTELDRALRIPSVIILTGASAGMLMGHIRPSLDIDFEIRPVEENKKLRLGDNLPQAIQAATRRVPVAVDYSGDISQWSQIDFLDYRKTALDYKQIGKLQIKIISPEYWTIGKMTRFVAQDIEDIKIIIKSKKIKSIPLINLWAKALTSSELSLARSSFKRHVHDFITTYAQPLWKQNPLPLIKHFNQQISDSS